MGISQKICNIIDQAANGKLVYELVVPKNKIPINENYRIFVGILQQASFAMARIVKIVKYVSSTMYILKPHLVDYLLSFIVMSYECDNCPPLAQFESFWSDAQISSGDNQRFLYYLFSELFDKIDIHRKDKSSDIHILAFMYLAYFGADKFKLGMIGKNFNSRVIRLRKRFENNKDIAFLKSYILKANRKLSKNCKTKIREIVIQNPSQARLWAGASGVEFYKNNIRILGAIDRKKHLAILNKKPLRNIPTDTVTFAIDDHEYNKLNVLQILACINSQYFLERLERINVFSDIDILSRRINYWIQKCPQVIDILNKNIHVNINAFLSLSCLLYYQEWHDYAITNNPINKIFNKRVLHCFLENNFAVRATTRRTDPIIVKALVEQFASCKLVDDDFILTIFFNKIYEKIFFNYPKTTVDQQAYQMLSNNFNSMKPSHINIIGLPTKQIRNRECLRYFLLKFQIVSYSLRQTTNSLTKNKPTLNDLVAGHKPRNIKQFSLKLI